MNLLDENFPDDQVALLRQWGVPFRRIGREVAAFGIQDDNLLPFLHRQRRATLFTLDDDFFQRRLCHPAYALVWLDVRADDAAEYLRRLLRHPRFRAVGKRMGTVVRVHHDGVHYWERNRPSLQRVDWPKR